LGAMLQASAPKPGKPRGSSPRNAGED